MCVSTFACMHMSIYASNKNPQRCRQAVRLSISDLRKRVSGGSGCKRVAIMWLFFSASFGHFGCTVSAILFQTELNQSCKNGKIVKDTTGLLFAAFQMNSSNIVTAKVIQGVSTIDGGWRHWHARFDLPACRRMCVHVAQKRF